MDQVGHRNPNLTLRIYAQVMTRRETTPASTAWYATSNG
jgi:hypothetical protein